VAEVNQILENVRSDGPRRALSRHWDRIKELHEVHEAFSVQQIVWLFDRCRCVPALRAATIKRRDEHGEVSVALGTLMVQLFTNFVCHQIPNLQAAEITCFVEALTSNALPMDEFWLFMMAKQIQDTSDRYSPYQIVTVARCYASKGLEDEEFFEALCSAVHKRLSEFNLHQLAHFLYSCARVRFLHQERDFLGYFYDVAELFLNLGVASMTLQKTGTVQNSLNEQLRIKGCNNGMKQHNFRVKSIPSSSKEQAKLVSLNFVFSRITESPLHSVEASGSQELCEAAFPLFEDRCNKRRCLLLPMYICIRMYI